MYILSNSQESSYTLGSKQLNLLMRSAKTLNFKFFQLKY